MRTTITALTAMMAGASVDVGFSKFDCTPLGGATNAILVRSRPNDDKSKVDRSMLARSRELRSKVDQSSFDRSILDKSIPAISKLMFTTQRGTLSEECVSLISFPMIPPCLTSFLPSTSLIGSCAFVSMHLFFLRVFLRAPTPDQSQLDISQREMCEREWRRRYGMIYGGVTDCIVYGDMMAALNAFLKRYFRSKEFKGMGGDGGINR